MSTRCIACGAEISRYAATCPRCKAPQPQKRAGSTVGLAILVVLLILATVWALAG